MREGKYIFFCCYKEPAGCLTIALRISSNLPCILLPLHSFFRIRVLEYERASNVAHQQKMLIKSSENGEWSVIRAFLKYRNEVPWSHEQILLQLKDELEKYWHYYSSLCDDDMNEQFLK